MLTLHTRPVSPGLASRFLKILLSFSLLVLFGTTFRSPLDLVSFHRAIQPAFPVSIVSPGGSLVSLDGYLSTRWIDNYSRSGLAWSKQQYVLQTSNEKTFLLVQEDKDIVDKNKLSNLAGHNVRVRGVWTAAPEETHWGMSSVLKVSSVELLEPAKAPPLVTLISGSQPYLTLLCKFPEEATVTHPKSWFETMLGSQYPGMDHYWQEVSYNTINMSGSALAGWYTLPKTRAEYINAGGDVGGNKSRDCMTAADADVYFPSYVGINIIIDNEFTTCCNISAGAGTISIAQDGGGEYRYTFSGTSSFTPHYVLGVLEHEVGHTFGMGHSSGPYADVYDSGWDVMSGYASGLTCDWTSPSCFQDAEYAYLGPHPIAYNKTVPGWIPEAKIFSVPVGTGYQVTLERLAQPNSSNVLMIRIPINGSDTEFYTAEARKFVGYDAFLAQKESSEAVLIHRVDSTRDLQTGPADVVDGDNNGNTNDAGSAWVPGEVYVDSGDDISISVLSSTPSGFVVRVTNHLLFSDVLTDYWASSYIERLYAAGITGGCATNPLQYCPEVTVTRAQMAVFLLRGIHGSSYSPPALGGSTGFSDVPLDHWAAAWIKQLAAEGITGGCGSGKFCPEYPVTRDQMAVFLLRSEHGSTYSPPAVGGSTGFGDVPSDHWAAAWIKQLVTEGITSGCGGGNYCPSLPVTRAQMAVFLVRTFNLP